MTTEAIFEAANSQDKDGSILETYGITRTSLDIFLYGGYRYTNLQDAVAEAQRHPLERSAHPVG